MWGWHLCAVPEIGPACQLGTGQVVCCTRVCIHCFQFDLESEPAAQVQAPPQHPGTACESGTGGAEQPFTVQAGCTKSHSAPLSETDCMETETKSSSIARAEYFLPTCILFFFLPLPATSSNHTKLQQAPGGGKMWGTCVKPFLNSWHSEEWEESKLILCGCLLVLLQLRYTFVSSKSYNKMAYIKNTDIYYTDYII